MDFSRGTKSLVIWKITYIASKLPVRYGVRVDRIAENETVSSYVVDTTTGTFAAQNVVVATGLYQFPKIPRISSMVPGSIKQLHSDAYRNAHLLPAGSVLVVGSAQSGAQITEDLMQAGRKVYLSVSRAGRVPRRYRDKDANWWHQLMGDYDRTVEQLPSPKAKFATKPHLSGTCGGHTINLHQFARDGVSLLGRIEGMRGKQLLLARDLQENLANADRFEAEFVKNVDDFIARNSIAAPDEAQPELLDGFSSENPSVLDLEHANITSVIWATGYGFDFSSVQLPVFDSAGYPIQKRGVTDYPGLYFIGLPWLHNARSGLLFGLKDDAAYIASHLEARTFHSNWLSGLQESSAIPARTPVIDGGAQ